MSKKPQQFVSCPVYSLIRPYQLGEINHLVIIDRRLHEGIIYSCCKNASKPIISIENNE